MQFLAMAVETPQSEGHQLRQRACEYATANARAASDSRSVTSAQGAICDGGGKGSEALANDALSSVVSDAVQGSSVEELEAEYQKLQASSQEAHLAGFVAHAGRYAGAAEVGPSPRSQHLSAFIDHAGRYGAGGGGGRDEHTTSPF